jgi:hypothetical protein
MPADVRKSHRDQSNNANTYYSISLSNNIKQPASRQRNPKNGKVFSTRFEDRYNQMSFSKAEPATKNSAYNSPEDILDECIITPVLSDEHFHWHF